eukprot:tig00000383_g24671.t1
MANAAEQAMSNLSIEGEKKNISMVVIGHVDSGKSTLMGHLLYDLGVVSQKTMHKYEKEAKQMGKESFRYAWVLDEHAEERARGVTIDVGITFFETPHRKVTLLDAPGHRDFIPNMISGASQADVAVLVVDATTGEFESGFEAGGQTKEHCMLVRSLGVAQLVVAVNKMDNAGYSQERFEGIGAQLVPFLKQTGFKEKQIRMVPVSGLTGENLAKAPPAASPLLAWYKGPTLADLIDTFEEGERMTERPFRMCVTDVYKSQQLGVTAAGRVDAGSIAVGQKVHVAPVGQTFNVKGLHVRGETAKSALAGDSVEIGLQGADISQLSAGLVLCDAEKPVQAHARFEAQLVTMQIAAPLLPGQQLVLHLQSVQVPATLKALIAQVDRATGEVAPRKPRCLAKNTTATVEIALQRPTCLELYSDCRPLGRFMLRDGPKTVAAGIVTKLLAAPAAGPARKGKPAPGGDAG